MFLLTFPQVGRMETICTTGSVILAFGYVGEVIIKSAHEIEKAASETGKRLELCKREI